MASPVFSPSDLQIATSEVSSFIHFCARRVGRDMADTDDLAAWSTAQPDQFWNAVWDYFGVIGDKGERLMTAALHPTDVRFFPEARLNYAENLLLMGAAREPGATALYFQAEDKSQRRWTWADLTTHVSRLQQALREAGVGVGDRVAALLPNCPEAVAAMLAAVSLGATWCSASPDFGARAVLDRFGQILPKVLFATDGYWYGGKRIEIGPKLGAIVAQLPSLQRTVIVEGLGEAQAVADNLHNGITFSAFESSVAATALRFERLPFDHPLFILFSSGTTGAPKCIVHRAGGVLLQHVKEHALHANVRPGDRLFYFTTLGWMMWNWLVSGLARGATLALYDGSPFHPDANVLWDMAERQKITHFGTSAKYIDTMRKHAVAPSRTHQLSHLRSVLSTGSPLLAENFDYVMAYVAPEVHLASISGGTDIVSCFVCGDPTKPVWRGEIQRAGFGMDVQVWTDQGQQAAVGEKGELVCTNAFPSMPLGFWGDDGTRYRDAYFSRFEGVWCQGDFAERRESGGFVIHGRSDATLNPGGVRIGTAEIYAEVEKFAEVRESVVIGQETGDDVRVILFVTMADGVGLDDDLIKRIKTAIRAGSSPRHVPALILPVVDIPRTKSGKVTELAVREVVHGRPVKNTDSLANPAALDNFRDIPALLLS